MGHKDLQLLDTAVDSSTQMCVKMSDTVNVNDR